MKSFLIAVSVLVLVSCNSKKTDPGVSGQAVKLNSASIYNADSIKVAITSTNDADKEAAKKKFLEGTDQYKNKKDLTSAIASFKASLLLYPSEKTYFELAGALADNKNYDEALQSLQVAEQMNYSPMANVLYRKALIYAEMPTSKLLSDGYTKYNDSMALKYMEIALQMGYSRPADFMKEKAFDLLRINNDWQFKSIYNNAMSGNKDPEKLAWETYRDEFQQVKLPLAINTVWIYNQKYENAIGYDYEKFVPEMRSNKFSREVENEYYYVGKVKSDSAYSALLYAGKNMWVVDGRGYSPVYIFLVTYSSTGKIIDKMLVGGQKTFTDNFRTMVLNENFHFEIKDFKNTYEKDPEKDGYEKNKVVKSDLLTTAYYKINSQGKFEKEKQLAIE